MARYDLRYVYFVLGVVLLREKVQTTEKGYHIQVTAYTYVFAGYLPLRQRRSRARDPNIATRFLAEKGKLVPTIESDRSTTLRMCFYDVRNDSSAPPSKLLTLAVPRLASISATPGNMARAVTVLRTVADGEAVAVPTARAPRSNACTHLRRGEKRKRAREKMV